MTRGASLPFMPRGIWALGIVSLFMDTSSELIHSLLPVFMVSILGASAVAVGLIEGVAEATASITKVFSGWLSDRMRKRKVLTVIGYGLAAVTKPLFPLAASVAWVFAARFIDRIGKGIRGAPRDALVADLAPQPIRGAAYGLRQSLDTVGAFAGPLLAVTLMHLLEGDMRAVFWFAIPPAFAAVVILVVGVKEPERLSVASDARPPIRMVDLARLPSTYWRSVGIAAVLTLARFSEAFLVLAAQAVGLAIALVPLVMVVMNIAYALSAYPAGVLSDRLGRRGVLIVGIAALIAADLMLAAAEGISGVVMGVVLWGLHMGLTQGLLATLVADAAPPDLRGTAFGMFHLISGIAMLAASVIAGGLWQAFGPSATFLAGAAFTALALVGLLVSARRIL